MPDAAVVRALLLDQHLPEPFETGRVEVRRITMPPGAPSGPHRHNGPVFGIVLSGSVRFQVEDGPVAVLTAGDPFHEPGDRRITAFDAGDDGAVFVGVFLVGPDGEARMTPEP